MIDIWNDELGKEYEKVIHKYSDICLGIWRRYQYAKMELTTA